MGAVMNKQVEKVELLVQNRPGVLNRVVGHIRHEGWNIKSLNVDETDEPGVSLMQIAVEGLHTKLAQVVERMLQLDCVQSVSILREGRVLKKERAQPTPLQAQVPSVRQMPPQKRAGSFRILTINPGSTSTKFAVYDEEEPIFTHTIRYDREQLDACGTILGQRQLRTEGMVSELNAYGIDIAQIDAIAGRGGLIRPIESGTYLINDAMLEDLHSAAAAVHASALGAIIAGDIAAKHGMPAYVVDPIVVDEMDPYAKLTGMPGVQRASVFHALNQKVIARRLALQMGMAYENARFIVAHMGGGITIGAHRYGRVIDVNDALSGEGPFTPERSGNIPALPLIDMCFSGEYTKQEMVEKVTKAGGMQGYLGTNDLTSAQRMISEGDEFAALVVDSMAYQVAKEIGAMAAVLEFRVDAIVLTGGLAYSNRFTGAIKNRVDALAKVHVFPGEDEMLALASGVLSVLRGTQSALHYGQ